MVPESPFSSLFSSSKRKIFVSYHHAGDQSYYDVLTKTFSETYEIVTDNSLERLIDSDDAEYVMRRIREKHIKGSSCTIVLCGAETPKRKYVDWEVKATLDMCHGLIGVNLPTNVVNINGHTPIPDRLFDNYRSGYALWYQWLEFTRDASILKSAIETAIARPKAKIVNNRPMMSRNGG